MKYTYDPATGMPEFPDLDQEFEVTLTRRDLERLSISVQTCLDRLRQDMASTRHGHPSNEPAAHGLLNTLARLSQEASRQYWRLHGHPENWQYRHTPTTHKGENQ